LARRPAKFLLLASGPFLLVPHEGMNKETLRKQFHEKHSDTLARHDGKPILYCIIAANILIFTIWQYAQYSPTKKAASLVLFMKDHFVVSWNNFISRRRLHTAFTSCFSHFNVWHIALNMYVLWNFGTFLAQVLGVGNFLSLYLGSGICSSIFSIASNKRIGTPRRGSLGASGCLFGLIAAFVFHDRKAPLHIVVLPQWTFEAQYGLAAIMALDITGLLLRWKIFDHAGHLGGIFTGAVAYCILRYLYGDKKGESKTVVSKDVVYEGPLTNFHATGDKARLSYPHWSWLGGVKNGRPHGPGQFRNDLLGWVWSGNFNEGEMGEVGHLESLKNGRLLSYPVRFDGKKFTTIYPNNPLQPASNIPRKEV